MSCAMRELFTTPIGHFRGGIHFGHGGLQRLGVACTLRRQAGQFLLLIIDVFFLLIDHES